MGEAKMVCESELNVLLDSDEIVVTKPGTLLLLAYRKAVDEQPLVLTRSSKTRPPTTAAITEFPAHAFQAVVTKARELVGSSRKSGPEKKPWPRLMPRLPSLALTRVNCKGGGGRALRDNSEPASS